MARCRWREPQIGFDPASKHGGSRSLVLAFKSVSGQDFRQISQIVAVESNARYRLEFYARTGDLKSNATVRWDVMDANDERILASSTPVPTGNSDWQNLLWISLLRQTHKPLESASRASLATCRPAHSSEKSGLTISICKRQTKFRIK
jgi:hypothetical protein